MAQSGSSLVEAPHESASPRLERILACTDYSTASFAVLEQAARISLACKAALTIIHVCEYGPMSATTEAGLKYIEHLYKEEKNNLERARDFVRALGVEAETVLLEGKARMIVLDQIQRRKIDLAVIGTQGYAGLERLIFGSTAEAIYRSAKCPVMIVGPSSQRNSEAKSRPVVFATDFNEPAVEAARLAAEFASFYHAPLHCVHVLPFSGRSGGMHTMVPSVMQNALRQLVPCGFANGMEHVCKVLNGESVAESVIEYAKSYHAQTIVLNARRLTPLASHLPPHITYNLIMKASCPVVTISRTAVPAVA